ncbi:MAG: four helix bundle protein [Amphiplicatus sp.]
MSSIKSYKDLQVWRRSMDLVETIYALVKGFPKQEEYRVTSQIIRAAISIPSNIAEGQWRNSRRDYTNFIGIAHGSLAEVETLLFVAERVKLASTEQIRPLVEQAEEISRMLNAMRQKLSSGK